jgi:ribonuclease G|tara:strand:- start:1404 stop:2876 length:1473 start_codon:yes stop_codon:yes gene_type:complete
MAEEIIINVSPHESRVAVVEQGLLQEIFIERTHSPGTVGNIYKGKVLRVLPGMQSAFVDIGSDRAAFMHVSDLVDSHEVMVEDRGPGYKFPPISSLIHEGKEVLVQVSKEPIGTKGARITSSISLASRYLVYLPKTDHVGISQRIEEDVERERLKQAVAGLQEGGDGFIVRTAAEGIAAPDICQDAKLLRSRWQKIAVDNAQAKAPAVVYEDLPLPLRVMRDIITAKTTRILVDRKETESSLARFLDDFIPEKAKYLELSHEKKPLFDGHNLEDQIEAALDRRVSLKSGGYLIVDQTEAMTTVDVNTGTFVGRKDLEDTIYRTNLEAASSIPRQLRLRNMGGIVIIDFIDMEDEEHRRQVLRVLEKGQHADRVKWKITQISELGLVEMTRKRTRESLLRMLCEPCGHCDGRGFIKTAESVCLEIFKEIQRQARKLQKVCLVMASQSVIDRLLDEDAACVREISDVLELDIRFQVEASYSQEQFDVVEVVG